MRKLLSFILYFPLYVHLFNHNKFLTNKTTHGPAKLWLERYKVKTPV